MRILSWNIQYGRAAGGSSGLLQTLHHIRSLGRFDVICLQEIARNFEEYCAAGQMDQMQIIKDEFPDYQAVWGTGFSWPTNLDGHTKRMEFGNLTLVNGSLLDYKVHQLPLPAAAGQLQMQRVAVEAIVDTRMGPLSICNTHLAFHDEGERQSQVAYLCQLDADRLAQIMAPKQASLGAYAVGYLAVARILCGDCNFGTDFAQYLYMLEHHWTDAWSICGAAGTRPHTCGLYDLEQWPEGSHSRDFFWLSSELAESRISYQVDTETTLSDHQPLILELEI